MKEIGLQTVQLQLQIKTFGAGSKPLYYKFLQGW